MGVLALLLAAGYLGQASDPCSGPPQHDLLSECRRAETPVVTESRPLTDLPVTAFGVLRVQPGSPALPQPSRPVPWSTVPAWVACDLGQGGCF